MTATRRAVVCLAAVASVAAALVPVAHGATWTATRTLTSSGDVQFRTAMGVQGLTAVTWADGRGVHVALKPAGGGWTAPRRVSDGRFGVARPAVAVTGRGEVVVAWAQNGTRTSEGGPIVGPLTIRARVRGAGGTWGEIRRIGTSSHFIDTHIDLAANARGEAIATWRGVRTIADDRRTEAVQSAFRRPSTAFGATQTVRDPETSRRLVTLPRVALDPLGVAHVSYGVGNPAVVRLATRGRGATGGWLAPRDLADAPGAAPVLAVARDRTATVVWRTAGTVPETSLTGAGPLEARSRRPDGRLGPRQRLSDDATASYDLAVAPDGEVTVTWAPEPVFAPGPVFQELRWTRRLAGEEAFAPAQVVAGVVPTSDFHGGPAALGDGTVLQASTAGARAERAQVIARAPGGTFSATPELDQPGFYPLVVAAGARAVAVWAVPEGERVRLVAAARIP